MKKCLITFWLFAATLSGALGQHLEHPQTTQVAPPQLKWNIVLEYLSPQTREHFFPGCEDQLDKILAKQCADEKMILFINANLNFQSKMCLVEGTVIVQFTAFIDGSIRDETIVKDIGNCGEEVLRVVRKMPRWSPGKSRGRPAVEKYTLTVQFKLE